MTRKIEKMLHLAADMQHFAPQNDALNELVQQNRADELTETDLDLVAAASAVPRYDVFLQQAENRKKN